MADLMSHINQANHNEQCAQFLIDDASEYRDWAITAAFYSAVHLAEASFNTTSIGHSTTAKDKRQGESIHEYRERKVRERAHGAYKGFKKLREASQYARYLAPTRRTRASHRAMMNFYTEQVVRDLVETKLLQVREELEKAFNINLSRL